MKRPKVILFDWDNTLIHSKSILFNALKHTLNQLDLDHKLLSAKEFKDNMHLSTREAFPKIFGANWEHVRDIYEEYFSKSHLDHLTLMPGAVHTLEILSSYGIIMSIVSNKEGKFVREEIARLQLGKYFHAIVGAYDAESDKPSGAPAYMALKNIMTPEECREDNLWFVGDSIADMECAYNINALPVLLNEHQDIINEISKIITKCIITPNHDELIALFRKTIAVT